MCTYSLGIQIYRGHPTVCTYSLGIQGAPPSAHSQVSRGNPPSAHSQRCQGGGPPAQGTRPISPLGKASASFIIIVILNTAKPSDLDLFINMNAASVLEQQKVQRETAKMAHDAKVEKDKQNRQVQKQKVQDRREKEKKRTQKQERRA